MVSDSEIQKILVLRFSSIGDVVLTTPVVRVLREQLGAEVDFLTKKSFAPIVEANPFVNRVFAFEKNISEAITASKSTRYDAIVDLHGNFRSLQVKLAHGSRAFVFEKKNLEKWLLVNLKIDRMGREPSVAKRYLETVEPLGCCDDGRGLDFFVPEKEAIDVAKNWPFLIEKGFTAFVVGATHLSKKLPRETILEVCQKAKKPIALLGGPGLDAENGAWIEARSEGKAVNFCGKTSLFGSASILRQAENVVAHDTGLMHVAAAFQKKIVVVWGNTTPRLGFAPFFGDEKTGEKGRAVFVENEDLGCRPCSKIGRDRCPRGHWRCVRDISADQILEKLATF